MEMKKERGEVRIIILKIQEHRKLALLNKRLIQTLEEEGGDAERLKKEVEWLEDKIKMLQTESGHYLEMDT
jgi:methylaspartate ammonia-lyase